MAYFLNRRTRALAYLSFVRMARHACSAVIQLTSFSTRPSAVACRLIVSSAPVSSLNKNLKKTNSLKALQRPQRLKRLHLSALHQVKTRSVKANTNLFVFQRLNVPLMVSSRRRACRTTCARTRLSNVLTVRRQRARAMVAMSSICSAPNACRRRSPRAI